MIYDDLKNLKDYKAVPIEVLNFISNLNVNMPDGRYGISDRIYANIESYNTKNLLDAKLEAHKKYIDLQFLLKGEERINYANIDGLTIINEYNPDKDILFYKTPLSGVGRLYLNKKKFAIFYPQDAHAPQINSGDLSNQVKKVVVKIAVNN